MRSCPFKENHDVDIVSQQAKTLLPLWAPPKSVCSVPYAGIPRVRGVSYVCVSFSIVAKCAVTRAKLKEPRLFVLGRFVFDTYTLVGRLAVYFGYCRFFCSGTCCQLHRRWQNKYCIMPPPGPTLKFVASRGPRCVSPVRAQQRGEGARAECQRTSYCLS